MKDPITDRGTKKSAKGLLRVEEENGEYVLYEQQSRDEESRGELRTVFMNSQVFERPDESLTNIRSRLVSPNS
jgi:nicotinamide phosphoribosyltransferase